MEVFQPMLWIQFCVLVTIEEDADPPRPAPPNSVGLAVLYSVSNGSKRKDACSLRCPPKLASHCEEALEFPVGAEAGVGGEKQFHPLFPWKQHTILTAWCRTEFQERRLFTGTCC